MSSAEAPIVETVWIDAAPDRVFPFFTDARRMERWLGEAAELDPAPGGRFAVDISDRLVRGSYVELEPPRRVVFTWGDAGSATLPPGASRVEVELTARDGGTEVRLVHHGLSGSWRDDHLRGWQMKLRGLVDVV